MDADIIEEMEMDSETESGGASTNEVPDKGENRLKFYVQRLKLAVAVAVIRSTPPEMTPEMYASHLIQCVKLEDDKWKDKCENLERELIALEEKIQTFSLKEKFHMHDVDMDCLTQDKIFEPEPQQPVALSSTLVTKILNTTEFVRSFIFLGSVMQREDVGNGTHDHQKLGESVLRSVILLFEYLRSKEGLRMEFDIIQRAVDEIRRLFDSRAIFFEGDLVKASMVFVENLLLDMFRTLEMNMVEYQHRRSILIQMMAEQKKLTTLILSRLLREITVLSDNLCAAFDPASEDIMSLLRVENAYFVFQTTEGTLRILRQQNSALNFLKIPKYLIYEWNKSAEKSLLEIGPRFPMYSMYLWRIKTVLKDVYESDMQI